MLHSGAADGLPADHESVGRPGSPPTLAARPYSSFLLFLAVITAHLKANCICNSSRKCRRRRRTGCLRCGTGNDAAFAVLARIGEQSWLSTGQSLASISVQACGLRWHQKYQRHFKLVLILEIGPPSLIQESIELPRVLPTT